MNRMTRSALGVGATLALSFGGLSTATATEAHEPSSPPPSVSERIAYDDKTIFPKYRACKDKIILKEKGAFKVISYGNGKLKFVFEDWSYAKLHNPKTGKSVTVGSGGDGLLRINEEGTARGRAEGENLFVGKGVHGIVYTKGRVKFTVENFGTIDEEVTIHKVKGTYVELCKKLGTKPVLGKVNTPPVGYVEPPA